MRVAQLVRKRDRLEMKGNKLFMQSSVTRVGGLSKGSRLIRPLTSWPFNDQLLGASPAQRDSVQNLG